MKGYYQIIICSISFIFVANLNGRYILIVQSTYKTADGVLTSCLEQTSCKLFFGTQVLPKNRGACVDTRFWHGQKHNQEGLKWKNDQSEKVSYRQKEKL